MGGQPSLTLGGNQVEMFEAERRVEVKLGLFKVGFRLGSRKNEVATCCKTGFYLSSSSGLNCTSGRLP